MGYTLCALYPQTVRLAPQLPARLSVYIVILVDCTMLYSLRVFDLRNQFNTGRESQGTIHGWNGGLPRHQW